MNLKGTLVRNDDHHLGEHLVAQDRLAGEVAAYYLGDTYIDWMIQNPSEQWTRIMYALRVHGIEIHFNEEDTSIM